MAENLSMLEKLILKEKKQNKEQDQKRSAEEENTQDSSKPLLFSKRRMASISFIEHPDDRSLQVTIDTENLLLRSVTKKDEEAYAKLYGDKEVMEKFATGVAQNKEAVGKRIITWTDR